LMQLNKLTQKQESDICLACGECCKRYSITLLPDELTKISKKLKISKKKFLEENCELFVKVFPKSTSGVLTCPTAFFPKKVSDLLYNDFNYLPEGFFVVPQIALKRKENGGCLFLDSKNSCKIYTARPSPCKLFPFLVVEGYNENYPFCELYKKTYKDYSKISKAFQKKITTYFKTVDKKGMKKVWGTLPQNGKFFLNELFLGNISSKNLEIILSKKIK
jgi:Fe-S-cluster containining protein